MRRKTRLFGLFAIFGVALCGCGKSPPAADTAVRGQILFRGMPLAGGTVVFAPNAERGGDGPVLVAELAEDGSFTVESPNGKPIGGWYRIAVAAQAGATEVASAERPYPGLPGRYRNPERSGLECELKAGIENIVCFDLDEIGP